MVVANHGNMLVFLCSSQRARVGQGQREKGRASDGEPLSVHGACPEYSGSDLRQSGSRVPDSWLNLRWTLSSCLVRTSSWGTMAAELSLSRLSFLLLRTRTRGEVRREGHIGRVRGAVGKIQELLFECK